MCTNCGSVLESRRLVSEVEFVDSGRGGKAVTSSFVRADEKGGGGGLGHDGREVTLRKARKKIQALAQQLRLRPDHIDMAFYFFKLALSKHLTRYVVLLLLLKADDPLPYRGRKSTHVIAACVYITCRTEGTSHMLIDFSDILQVPV